MGEYRRAATALVVLLVLVRQAIGQGPATAATQSAAAAAPTVSSKPAEDLYLKLRRVGLNPAKTYNVRNVSLIRPGFQIVFEDGTIAFTGDILGRPTGAFFQGDGEVLLTPPNRVERASMALGTRMAILETRFTTSYIRFNDDTFGELQAGLRPADDPQGFVARWNETATNLSERDALRLLVSFSRWLPASGEVPLASSGPKPGSSEASDHFLHARVEGPQLGTFDLQYDSTIGEQVAVGQTKAAGGLAFYDVWASFAVSPENSKEAVAPEDPVAVESYQIRTEVRPPTEVSIDASLKVRVLRGGERTLLFELSRFLQVKQIEADGHAVEFIQNQALEGTELARRGNDLVAVVFPQPLNEGEMRLRLVYGGDVLSDAGGGLLYVGARGAWYPNRGLCLADFDLTFRYPRAWTLIATGKRIAGAEDGQEPGDGGTSEEVESHWKTDRPIALAGFNLGKYVKATAHAGDVDVETFAARGVERSFPTGRPAVSDSEDARQIRPGEPVVLPQPAQPSPAKHAQAVADEAARAVDFFAQRFGPFPYDSLKLTQMPGSASQGWPGLIFLSSLAFLSPEEEERLHMGSTAEALRRLMLAHEAAHQWWGDQVIWKSYRDQWMVEALANYCALMKLETERPGEFRQILEKYREDLLTKNKDGEQLREAGPVTLGQRLITSHFPQGYEAISYGRGTWLFHMLRTMMLDGVTEPTDGEASHPTDEPFVRALHKVAERYAGKAINTHELLAVFAEEVPRRLWYEGRPGLEWFEHNWIEGTEIPQFSLRGVKFSAKAGGAIASGVLLQKDAPEDLVTSVPIYAVVRGRNVPLGRVFAEGPETPIHFNVPPGTSRLVVDPNGTLLRK